MLLSEELVTKGSPTLKNLLISWKEKRQLLKFNFGQCMLPMTLRTEQTLTLFARDNVLNEDDRVELRQFLANRGIKMTCGIPWLAGLQPRLSDRECEATGKVA